MTFIPNLLTSWGVGNAINAAEKFLLDNPTMTDKELYRTIKIDFVYNNRIAVVEGCNGRLLIKAPATGCCGAFLYK